jgi:hypothetical protein
LQCGVLRWGFTAAKCESCERLELIAFSCKSRGWCPSCCARRAHDAAAHLEAVLPQVAYRQWTLSLPSQLRWPVVKDVKLLRSVEKCLVKAIFRWQRRRAKELGVDGTPAGAAVSFVQFFNGHLALQPHLHLLVPEGVWSEGTFVELPPPEEEEVESVLSRMLRQLARVFEEKEEAWPEDELEALQLEGAQLRLALEPVKPAGRRRRTAAGQGYSLHAGTWVHGNDRDGLARLARYGARGPIAESRLCRREDGRYAYETKKGVTLVLTAEQLVKRLLWLIPPPRLHLTSFHGVFASHSKVRADLLPQVAVAPARDEATVTKPSSPGLPAPVDGKRPRLDWATLYARTWGVDVWTCRCGGRRKVLAVVTSRQAAEEMLRNMGLTQPSPPLPVAQSPPQLELAV